MKANNLFLIIVGLIFIIAELFVGVEAGFDLVLIGTAIVFGGVIGYLFGSVTLGIGAAIFFSLLYIFLGRRFVKDKLKFVGQKSNIDSLIDKTGLVTEGIKPHQKGKVKIAGETWLAEAEEIIPENTEITVVNVEGVTLKVERRQKGG